ncbi:MAG: dihydroxyacetone kinase subunit L [Eubacteriales bacterium]|nr:dihydroxyacetone kinase subunit L [Eubacteriales bacterium]
MVSIHNFIQGLQAISRVMQENRDYLIKLDQRNGDGDLGISMSNGFQAVYDYAAGNQDQPFANLVFRCSATFNEAAPSSLGTILAFIFMGMGKYLKKACANENSVDFQIFVKALKAGMELMMDKAGSKPGEKTIVDSLYPAVQVLEEKADEDPVVALLAAKVASEQGMENTKNMRSVHGRAAYYGDKSIGIIDGGAVVGHLIFQALADEFEAQLP